MLKRDDKGRFLKGSTPWNKGVPCREETKRKLSKIAKDKYNNGYVNPFEGKRHSAKTRKLISERTKEAMKNPKIRKTISSVHKGKHRSPKTELISKRVKEMWKDPKYRKMMGERLSGKNNPFFGKHHTKETKEKLSEIFKGEKNHFWEGL